MTNLAPLPPISLNHLWNVSTLWLECLCIALRKTCLYRLSNAYQSKNQATKLKMSAELRDEIVSRYRSGEGYIKMLHWRSPRAQCPQTPSLTEWSGEKGFGNRGGQGQPSLQHSCNTNKAANPLQRTTINGHRQPPYNPATQHCKWRANLGNRHRRVTLHN